MDKFKLDTSFQFPFFKLNELVSYSEVKKPSGVAYMLLVLIKESKDKNAILSQVLENFGVPQSIHYIYADAIVNLINQDILTTDQECFSRNSFVCFKIGDFSFTEKGKKIFAEESIPTGVTREVKISVYYNVALKQLTFSMDLDLEPRPLMDGSALTDDFVNQFVCEKNVEDFINRNKGIKIPIYENGKIARYELIKKEEIITKVEELEKQNWLGKYECSLIIDGDTLLFKFEDSVIQRFFDEKFTSSMVNTAIGYKNKFQIKYKFAEDVKLSSFENREIVNILVPKEIDDILKQKCQMFITKGNYVVNNCLCIDNKTGLEKFCEECEFIIVDQADNKFAFVPGVFKFNNEILGDILIPLVLKIKISSEELKEVLSPFVDDLNVYTEQTFKTLVSVTKISKDYDRAYNVMNGYFTNDYEKNLVRLSEMKQTALLNANIFNKFKELLFYNYEEYLKAISEDNFETVIKITNNIPKVLNINKKDALIRIFENLKDIKDKKKIYETLVKKDYDKSFVALYVNPVEDALKERLATEQTLSDLINFDECISSLKKIANIPDYRQYTFDEEKIDIGKFKETYKTAKNLQKEIEIFRNNNKDLFQDYDGFMGLFEKVNNDFNMLEAAIKNPNNITQEIIDKKITSGDYQFVFVNLSAKLELILKNKYELSGNLSNMLSEARKNAKINKEIVADLHIFRENRNTYIHPDDRVASFTVEDLKRWSMEIFNLEEEKK